MGASATQSISRLQCGRADTTSSCSGRRGALTSYAVDELGLTFVDAPQSKRSPSPTLASELRKLCRSERIDLVHAYEWPPCLEAFCGPHLFDRVPVVFTVLSMGVAPFLPPSPPLIVGTEQIAASVRHRRGPVDLVEPVIDTASDYPGFDGTEFRSHWGLGDHPTVVVVSRLAFELKLEGIQRAIGAVEVLADEFDARLVIVGDGPARERIEQRANETNARTGRETVILTGELLDPRAAYAAADIVVGNGGSALRGMSFGRAVIVVGEDGFVETVEEETLDHFLWQGFYGLGDGDTSPGELAEHIKPLLEDPRRRNELGAFGRQIVEQRFSTEAGGRFLEKLYADLATSQSARSIVIREAAVSTSMVAVYKMRRKTQRLLGRGSGDDFNAKTAAAAARDSGEPSRA